MHENHKLTFIEVEARLKVLRDLPLTNNHVFVLLWASHKDSIANVVAAGTIADRTASQSADEASLSPLSSRTNIFTSLGGQASAAAAKVALATAAFGLWRVEGRPG